MKEGNSMPILMIFTIGAVVCSLALYQELADTERLSAVGAYFGGVGTSVAIIWIVYNAILQTKSINIQAEELQLQRAATQKIAASTETATLISMLELAENSIYYDLSFLVRRYSASENSKFSPESIWDFSIESKEFNEWITREHESGSIPTITAISAICGKYDSFASAVLEVAQKEKLSELILGSSRLSHLCRKLSKYKSLATDQTFS